MTVVGVAVVSRENRPLAIRTVFDGSDGRQQTEERLKLLFAMHSSLDFVEEKASTGTGGGSRDPFLGPILHLEALKVFALVSTTRTRILVVVSTSGSSQTRDADVKHVCRLVHKAYVEATACNPFYEAGQPIRCSKRFDACIRDILHPLPQPMQTPVVRY